MSENRYTPFGEVRDLPASMSTDDPITETDFGYTGQRDLGSIGLMDYNARFYSPTLGRFIQPDTIVPNPTNPQSFNRFSYVGNNPMRFVDPSGHRPWGPDEDTPCLPKSNCWPESPREQLLGQWKDPLGGEFQGANFGEKRGVRPIDPNLETHCPGCREYHMSIDSGFNLEGEDVPIYAGAEGIVVFVNNEPGYDLGVYIIVEHIIDGEKFYSIYGHLEEDSATVEVGDFVDNNTQLALMGDTNTGVKHLHFEIRTSANLDLKNPINPANPLQGQRYWGYKANEWETYFLDLGSIYGYNGFFFGMPGYGTEQE